MAKKKTKLVRIDHRTQIEVPSNVPNAVANRGMRAQYYQDNKERLRAKARANYYKKKAKKLAYSGLL